MTVLRMDNILLVVDDLEAVKAFFTELGLELEGETVVEGESVDRLIGLDGVRATIASMRTPDGHGRIELDRYHAPAAIRGVPDDAPVNTLGLRRIMFAVDDIDAMTGRLRRHGAELIGEIVQYGDQYRLAYVRGPEGIVVGLAEDRSGRQRRSTRVPARTNETGSMQTRSFPPRPQGRSPAGADIRYLMEGRTGGMIHATVPPRQVNRATVHATVSEFWHVLAGEGQIWRRDASGEETTDLRAGVSVDIPVGTAFQYRCTGSDPLEFLCVSMPPWPGDAEATVVAGPWEPTAPDR